MAWPLQNKAVAPLSQQQAACRVAWVAWPLQNMAVAPLPQQQAARAVRLA
ncbi:MAG: hypothetical protein IJC73_08630 [Lentisphaeria bacterium]|nr:hypothetical protein [Lentisphaeria bacterium]